MKCPDCKVGNFTIERYVRPTNVNIRSKAKFKCDNCEHEEIIR